MIDLFSTSSLDTGRYISIATASLPPVVIFGLGSTVWKPSAGAGVKVKGRPRPAWFGIVWTLLTILWTFSLVTASFNFEVGALIVIQVFSILTLLCALMWLYQYKIHQKAVSAQVLLLTSLFSFLMVVTATTSPTYHKYANMTVATTIAPLFVWLTGATLFNYLEIN
jgi:hypothetical protein